MSLAPLLLASLCAAGARAPEDEPIVRLHPIGHLQRALRVERPPLRAFADHGLSLWRGASEELHLEEAIAIDRDLLTELITRTIEPQGWERHGWDLTICGAHLQVLAPHAVQKRIDSLLAGLADLLGRSALAVRLRVYRLDAGEALRPGCFAPAERTARRVALDRAGTLLWEGLLDAHPWIYGRASQSRSRLVVMDHDVEVASKREMADPVVVRAETGFTLLVRPTPLEDDTRVFLDVELDRSELAEVRRLDSGLELLGHLELPRIEFCATRLHTAIPYGGGVVLLTRGGPLGNTAFLLEIGAAPPASPVNRPGLSLLRVGFLLQNQPYASISRLHLDIATAGEHFDIEPEWEPRSLMSSHDLVELAFWACPDRREIDGAGLFLSGESLVFDVAPAAADVDRLRTLVRRAEEPAARSAHLEVLVVRADGDEPSRGALAGRIHSSLTLIGSPDRTARAALGEEWAMLTDYDIEISMAAGAADPITDLQFIGHQVEMRPVRLDRERALLDLAFHARELSALERTSLRTRRIGDLDAPTVLRGELRRRLELRVGERAWLGMLPGAGPDGERLHALVELVAIHSAEAPPPLAAPPAKPDREAVQPPAALEPGSRAAIRARYAGRFDDKETQRRKHLARGSERAVADALAWLAAHQGEDGSWDSDGFARRCPGKVPCDGPGGSMYDIGLSALALLAFLGDGHHPGRETPHRACVERGVEYLLGEMETGTDDGLIGGREGFGFIYGHALATLALCEACLLSENPTLRAPAQRAVNFILSARNPKHGWRYEVPPNGENDTSVTGWMVAALLTARDAGLQIDEAALAGAQAWFDQVTDTKTGRSGYTQRGEQPARPTGKQEAYPSATSESLTAEVLFCRIMMGATPRSVPILERQADLCLKKLPIWSADGSTNDLYYWYHGSHAMFQVGRTHWRRWNDALKKALLRNQRRDGHARGSWDPNGPWGEDGGRIYSTALGVLCLESGYRYARVNP